MKRWSQFSSWSCRHECRPGPGQRDENRRDGQQDQVNSPLTIPLSIPKEWPNSTRLPWSS